MEPRTELTDTDPLVYTAIGYVRQSLLDTTSDWEIVPAEYIKVTVNRKLKSTGEVVQNDVHICGLRPLFSESQTGKLNG